MNNHHINIIFPHQLFEKSPLPLEQGKVILIEEELFFNQYNFHKQKLAFHRASMKFYESFLKEKGHDVQYISATEKLADIRKLVATLGENGTQTVHFIDPTDDWQEIWDGLFWRFMHVHRDFFQQNPRLGMLVGTFDKMDKEKKEEHLVVAERYLGSLG